jgi:RHS repeat-associated protein
VGQENLRGRIATVMYSPTNGTANSAPTFEQATHYSYDIHGNVKSLIQDHSTFGRKRIDYEYELISGNVRTVWYQKDRWDQIIHYYAYDLNNRLKWVQTSQVATAVPAANSGLREQEAQYFYNKHGSLRRMELGTLKVQGIDYAYTIHGWLKGVNSGELKYQHLDMGQDGRPSTTNGPVARDAFGFVLGYYSNTVSGQNDYHPIGTTFFVFDRDGYTVPTASSLYNGNIPKMTTATRENDNTTTPGIRSQRMLYKYDQLQRLKTQDAYDWNGSAYLGAANYGMAMTYDYGGNIKTLKRKGDATTLNMDDLSYVYGNTGKPNRLTQITEAAPVTTMTEDLETEGANNYKYDNIGNLNRDLSEGDKTITWNVYNKITNVAITTPARSLAYGYDASGNRVRKESTTGGVTTKQWYVRDAQGNTLSVYKQVGTGTLKQDVDYLYGATRVAELIVNRDSAVAWNRHYYRIKGNRHYELTNHLGNVLAVVTDRKMAKDTTADAPYTPQFYLPDIYSVQNYYAFGQNMPKWSTAAGVGDPTKYRFGFNGKEDDDEWSKQDYGFRIYDGRIGRFLSVDPLLREYPELTLYQFASNIPICGIDLDGLEFYFSVEGAYLGQGPNIKDKSMYLAKEYFGIKNPKTGKALISAVDVNGEWSENLTKLYDNPNQAALEWSFENAVQSRSERVEFASRIGSKSTLDQNGNQITLFLNGTVVKAKRDNRNLVDVSTSILPSGWDDKNVVHSHLSGGKAEEFSEGVAGYLCEGDKGCAIACEYDIFLATPKGMLLKFSYKTETVEALYHNLPAGDQYSNPINPAYIKDKKGDSVKNTKFTIPNLQHE